MLQKIRQIVADVTVNRLDSISAESDQQNVPGWDSLAQINIAVTVESEFGVSFTPEELHTLNSVPKILDALQRQRTPV